MRHLQRSFLFVLTLSQAACASHPPASPAVDPSTLPPLPRSSIAAVVTHRAELGLSDDQVREMERLDQQRASEDDAVRAQLNKTSPTSTSSSTSGGASAGGGSAGAPGPAGMGGGRMGGGMRGGRMGGRTPRSTGAAGVNDTDRAARLLDRLDQDDTKAYLDAEGLLTDDQRARARDIASDYREQLYERRELLSHRAKQ